MNREELRKKMALIIHENTNLYESGYKLGDKLADLCEPYFRQLERAECVERVKQLYRNGELVDAEQETIDTVERVMNDAIKAIQTKGE